MIKQPNKKLINKFKILFDFKIKIEVYIYLGFFFLLFASFHN